MSKEKIVELLRQLHAELAVAEDLDSELSDQLRAATAEIEEVLEREEESSEAESESPGVIDQLRDAAERFEDSHPSLTNTVGRIADALSQLGI